MIIKVFIWIIAGCIILGLLVFLIGLILPTERVVSRTGHFNVTPEALYKIVVDNKNWKYRTGLKDLVIIQSENGIETWDEIADNGTVIRFRTKEKKPYSFYAFDMETKMFTGYWTGEFEANDTGTLFTATEYIRVRNPFVKTLSYLFFDVGKLMNLYQEDLQRKVTSSTQ